MFSIVRALMDRFKALFLSQSILELQADLIVTCADRKADLLRRAERFEQEGMADIAAYLRQQVESLSTENPLASVLAVVSHLQSAPMSTALPAGHVPPAVSNDATQTPANALPPGTLKKSRRP